MTAELDKPVIADQAGEQFPKLFADITDVEFFERSDSLQVEQNLNGHCFRGGKPGGFDARFPASQQLAVPYGKEIFAKIINRTQNFSNYGGIYHSII